MSSDINKAVISTTDNTGNTPELTSTTSHDTQKMDPTTNTMLTTPGQNEIDATKHNLVSTPGQNGKMSVHPECQNNLELGLAVQPSHDTQETQSSKGNDVSNPEQHVPLLVHSQHQTSQEHGATAQQAVMEQSKTSSQVQGVPLSSTHLSSWDTSQGTQANGSSKLQLKEFEPLTDILSHIPQKVQRGLKTNYEPLELTAVDANQYFIALGSNIGTVFLFDRAKQEIQRLKSEISTDSVTCVSLHHGLDDLVAVGYSSGTIYIFQLPNMMIGHSKQLERFIVSDVHKDGLTCLAWSTNGMKLFSGDAGGCVGCTEVDFYEGKSQSSAMLIESNTEIVQLHHGHKAVLVTTKHRCFVVQKDKITQIGSKDRKILGDFGACFIPAMCKPEDAQLYASRPGFRLWKASVNGTVIKTYIFKELLSQQHKEIPLLDFTVTNITKSLNSNQFGKVHLFQDKMLVTWDDCCLYVINPDDTSIVGTQKHIGRILNVAVCDTEIFVLRSGTDRNLIRISDRPVTRPASQLLRQLEAERLFKKEHPSLAKQEESAVHKHASKEAVLPKKEETKDMKNKPEKSPFKMFGENLLDKVKHIGKPTSIIDKVQEKLLSEKKLDMEHMLPVEKSKTNTKREVSPPGELPPVVELTSPNLIPIEIGPLIIETGSNSPEKLTGTQLQTSNYRSDFKQTGSGAVSALTRLQEDHLTEENSAPVYRIATIPEVNVPKPVKPEGEESIVFSRKKKKKPKGTKDRSSKRLDVDSRDSDTLSVNSTTSITSDNGETTPSVRLSSDDNPILVNNQVDESEEHRLIELHVSEPRISDPLVPASDTVTQSVSSVTIESESASDRRMTENTSETIETTIKESDTVSNAVADSKQVDSDSFVSKCSENASQENNCDKQLDKKSDSYVQPTSVTDNTYIAISGLSTDYKPSQSFNKSYTSMTEREVFRLNSDATDGMKSISDDKDKDNLVSSGSENFEYRSEAEKRLYKHIIGTDHDEDREKEILNSFVESDSKYTPSSLEKELKKLEMSTMADDALAKEQELTSMKQSFDPISPISLQKSGPPSIYTLYSKPGATAEDFYSKYAPNSPSDLSSPDLDAGASAMLSGIADDSADLKKVKNMSDFLKSVNMWTEVSAQGNIYSISVTNTHVWITDRSWNIFYSALNSPGVSWKKASGTASQISVSPDGCIVWGLNKNTVFAGTKITPKRPEGLKWVEAVRDVAYISVDDNCAWYIKTNHQVMVQKGLSKDRPCYTSQEVECSHRLKQIVCRAGVVWALTDKCRWLYRAGVTKDCTEGKEWKVGDSDSDNRLFSHLALGDDNHGWALDIVGQVWFCSGVTMATPRGEKQWWQVPLNGEYIVNDMTALDMLKSFSKKFDPQKLTVLLSAQNGGLIAVCNSVWVCPEYKHTVQACRGSIEGQMWCDAHPRSLSADSVWKTVVASNASQTNGLIWAQQPNGDIFTFSPDCESCTSIPGPPKRLTGTLFVCMCACTNALWGLTDNGDVFIREGMSELEPKGSKWHKLDLSQLDDKQLVHISCSGENIWSVDSDGMVWHRIGVKAPSDRTLNAAWLPVDNGDTVFTQVVASQQDWKVWAIDNRRQVYVRSGVTAEMPIGRKWIHVSGSLVMQITLSDNFVFALNHAGELLYRHGVSPEHITGHYWKKLPGDLSYISATPNNILWGINKEGQLVRRHTKYIVKATRDPPLSADSEGPSEKDRNRSQSSIGSDDGWELL